MKWLRRLSLGALAFVLLVVGLVALVMNTGWGARFVISQLGPMVPGEFRTAAVAGTLSGPLEISGLEYHLGGTTVRAEQLDVDAAVMGLMTGDLRIESVNASGLVVSVAPGAAEDTKPSGPLELPVLKLPLAVDIETLTLDDARLELPDQAPVVLDRLELRGGLAGGTLSLDRFRLASPLGRVSLQGRVATDRRYRTRLQADVTVHRPSRDLAGTLLLSGDLDELEVTLNGRPPIAARLEATLTGLPWPPAFDATLALDDVDPGAVGLAGLPAPLTGQLVARGDPNTLDLTGWLAAAEERVAIRELAVTRDGSRLTLESLRLAGADGATVAASGTVALGGDAPEVALDASWRDVAVPAGGGRVVTSPAGRVAVSGRPADYRARGELRLGGALPAGDWRFDGTGNLERFELSRLEAETMDGTLSASGHVAWRPVPAWSLAVEGDALDPSAVAPGWPGALGFRASTTGRVGDGGPEGSLVLERLTGTLRGREIAAQSRLEFQGLDTLEGELSVNAGESFLRARGRLADSTDVQLDVRVVDAGDWYPGASGSVAGELRLTGPREAPRLAGRLQGSGLALDGHRAETLELSLDAGLAPDAEPGRVRLQIAGAQLAGIPVDQAVVSLRGNRAAQQLELEVSDPERRLTLAGRGGTTDSGWAGSLRAMTLSGPRLGDWRLAQPADLGIQPEAVDLSRLCLQSDSGRLCARGQWNPRTGWRATADMDALPLALAEIGLRAVTDRPLELSGELDAEAELSLPPGGPADARVRFEGRDAAFALGTAEGLTRLELAPLSGSLRLQGAGLEAQARVGLDRAGSVSLDLASSDFSPASWQSSRIAGTVDIDLTDLSPLAPLASPLAAPAGALRGELKLDGALGALGLGGDLSLTGFSAQLPRAGITLEEGRLELEASAGELVFDGRVSSGGGETRAEGRLGFDAEAGFSGQARVTGSEFQAVDQPGMAAWVSPDVGITLRDRRLSVEGTVTVPRADVDAGELQGGGVSASPDVIVAGQGTAEAPPALQVRAEVDVILGEDISLRAPGFEGSADGRLHVSDRTGRPPLGQGQLSVSGSYEAYGQELTIRRGQLLFSDTPLDNPALNITAVRETRDVTAGVRIGGTARQPSLALFSEPPLGSESEILSYLLLGRPLDSASSSEGATLAGAATSIGLRGGGLLAQQIGARFGLEEVEVGRSEALDQSALTLGKYLSPRLYIGYGIGLMEPVSVVRLRYELTDRWALEAASGKETTAAIKFNYER